MNKNPIISGVGLAYRTLFWKKPPIDAPSFDAYWEGQYGGQHDPNPSEVMDRIRMMGADRVLDFGAGYGRIATEVSQVAEVFCFEPDPFLAAKARQRGLTVVDRLSPESLQGVKVSYSVRVMDYMSVAEIAESLRSLGNFVPTHIGWETRLGASKLRVARMMVPKIRVVINELVR